MLDHDCCRHEAPARRRALLLAVGAIVVLGMMGIRGQLLAAQREVKTVLIPVEGMACVACAASVKRTLRTIEGVTAVEVSLEKRTAEVSYTPGKVTPERLVAAINELGYRAGTPKEAE